MAFNSLEFLIFLPITILLYYLLPEKAGKVVLLAANIIFYASASIPLSLYIIASVILTYIFGILIEKNKRNSASKELIVCFGVIIQVAALAVFKYTDFFIESFNSVFSASVEKFNIVAPLGISFVTFTGISYLADVSRNKIKAEHNFLNYALFLSFFPKVIQGPIEKAGDMLPQFRYKNSFRPEVFREGFIGFVFGLFMKTVIADRLAVSVNYVFGDLSAHSGAEIIFAVILFAAQLYADFAGYSLIASGSASMLGFRLKRNFAQPYLSLSVSEFWRRWHISLNTFLKDYIYIPLGGNRCPKSRKYFNLMVTFIISGIWHGAAAGYIIWGALNGLYVVIESICSDITGKKSDGENNTVKNILNRIRTIVLIVFSWLFFRAETPGNISIAFNRIFTDLKLGIFISDFISIFKFPDYLLAGQNLREYIILAVSLAVLTEIDILVNQKHLSAKLVAHGNRFIRWAILYALIFAVIIFGVYGYGYNASSFIYTQF